MSLKFQLMCVDVSSSLAIDIRLARVVEVSVTCWDCVDTMCRSRNDVVLVKHLVVLQLEGYAMP